MLSDACTIGHQVKQEVWDLAHKTGFPVYSAPMGKTGIWEGYERYGGVRDDSYMYKTRSLISYNYRYTLVLSRIRTSRRR